MDFLGEFSVDPLCFFLMLGGGGFFLWGLAWKGENGWESGVFWLDFLQMD